MAVIVILCCVRMQHGNCCKRSVWRAAARLENQPLFEALMIPLSFTIDSLFIQGLVSNQ